MTCVECQEFLHAILDGGPDEVERTAAAHLAACPACRQSQATIRRLRDGMRMLPKPRPGEGFAERVARLVVAEQAKRGQRRRWIVGAALAASLLLAVAAGYRWLGRAQTNALPPAPIADASQPKSSSPSARETAADAGQAMASLSRRATAETMEQTRLLWPVAPVSFEGLDVQTPLEPSARSLRAAGQNVSEGLEPVADSARRAMNLFWREIPPVASEKKGS